MFTLPERNDARTISVRQKFKDQGFEIKDAYSLDENLLLKPNWLDENGEPIAGIYADIPNDAYHAIPAISSSQLKVLLMKSEAHYEAQYIRPEEFGADQESDESNESDEDKKDDRQDHFTTGDMIHSLFLEPWTVAECYYKGYSPKDLNGALRTDDEIKDALSKLGEPKTKAGEKKAGRIERLLKISPETRIQDNEKKLLAQKNKGKQLISSSTWDKAFRVYKKFLARPEFSVWIDHDYGLPELSIIAQCPNTGMWIRCRPDFLRVLPMMDGEYYPPIMTDVKSANSASQAFFSKSASDFGYHIQQAFYEYVWSIYTGDTLTDFGFVVAEFATASIVEPMLIDDTDIKYARLAIQPALARLKECYDKDEWNGYTVEGISNIRISKWANDRLLKYVEFNYEESEAINDAA